MTNHAHLLITGREKGAVSAMMQALGLRYVRYVNRIYHRTGTLFEGRFKSSLVESARYLLTCYRYIELNPVRAGMDPGDYRWSSYRHHALGDANGLITDHQEFLDLGKSPGERQSAYRALIREAIGDEEMAAIRLHLNKDCALGSARFQTEIEAMSKRRARVIGRGRPKGIPRKTK
jgi:putative transposase